MLQARGAPLEALEHYQAALALRPGDATVENALGGALLAANKNFRCHRALERAASARQIISTLTSIWESHREPQGISPARFKN